MVNPKNTLQMALLWAVPLIPSATIEMPKASSTTIARRKIGHITGDLAIRSDSSHSCKASRPNDTGNLSDSDGEDDNVLFGDHGAPTSLKSAWPLKYFQEMISGFYDMANMTGTLPQ